MKKVNNSEEKEVTEGRKQKISVTYTLRAFGENLKRMYEAELLTKEEATRGAELVKIARERFMGEELTFN